MVYITSTTRFVILSLKYQQLVGHRGWVIDTCSSDVKTNELHQSLPQKSEFRMIDRVMSIEENWSASLHHHNIIFSGKVSFVQSRVSCLVRVDHRKMSSHLPLSHQHGHKATTNLFAHVCRHDSGREGKLHAEKQIYWEFLTVYNRL
jgi:hypothetical protein